MKQIVKNYAFNSGTGQITFSDFLTIRLDRLQLIVDVTLNQLIYNFVDPTVATATVSYNVATLSQVPVSASSGDALMIVYDCAEGDPTYDALALPGEAIGAAGSSVPSVSTQVAGSDASSILHTIYVDSSGRVAQFDAGAVAVAPISQEATQVAVTDTSVLTSNASRGEFEVCNFSQTDICLSLGASAATWGRVGTILVAPNGYYARAYTGAVRAIHNNTRSGVATGGNSGTTCLLTSNEWP